MKQDSKRQARKILDQYLETNNYRRTSERYAILDAVFSIKGHFSLDQLNEYIKNQNFKVSRATLYNTLRLFIKLRLVVRHKLIDGTKYEARTKNDNHCHQVCTMCGVVTELNLPDITSALGQVYLKGFKSDGFALYLYGVCSACQKKMK